MFENKYELPPIEKNTRLRVIEVIYFLTFQPLYNLLDKHGYVEGKGLGIQFYELLTAICDVKRIGISMPFHIMYEKHARPTKREMVIALRYLGFSYSEINSEFGISKITVNKYLKEYIRDHNTTLMPKLTGVGIHGEIEKALLPVIMFLMPMGRVSQVLFKALKQNEILKK